MAIIYKVFNAYISDVFWPNLEKVGLLRLYLQHEKTISIFKIIKKIYPKPTWLDLNIIHSYLK